jgi:chromate transporter
MSGALAQLALLFAQLSLLAFGGGNTVLPEMQREVVDVHHWMTAADFAALFALAQAAPGPNMLVAALIGLRVAGLPGAVVATLGIITPSSLLTIAVVRLWDRFRNAPWRRAMQAGLVPVTAGLFLAAALLIAEAADRSLVLAALTAAVAGISLATRLHPLWLLAAGALLGVIGLA